MMTGVLRGFSARRMVLGLGSCAHRPPEDAVLDGSRSAKRLAVMEGLSWTNCWALELRTILLAESCVCQGTAASVHLGQCNHCMHWPLP